jgi:hypothetical protein
MSVKSNNQIVIHGMGTFGSLLPSNLTSEQFDEFNAKVEAAIKKGLVDLMEDGVRVSKREDERVHYGSSLKEITLNSQPELPQSSEPSVGGAGVSKIAVELSKLPEWQKRVIAEKIELDSKIERLTTFVYGLEYTKLPSEERKRLADQLQVMREYSQILAERIICFA